MSGTIRRPIGLLKNTAAALALVTAGLVTVAPALAESAAPLRLCSDPTNLPFSSDNPEQPGLYNEIGSALGKALGRPVTFTWYKSYFGKRTVRETLLSGQCDAMVGLPEVEDFMGPKVIFSKPIVAEGYALVTPKGTRYRKIDDLKGLRVAVQYESTPQNMLASRDEIIKVTVLNPDEGMRDLSDGKADAAIVWGPVAGWLDKTRYGGRFDIQPIEGDQLQWQTAIGFAKKNKALRDQVDAELPQLTAVIETLSQKYGLPTAKPLQFTAVVTPQAASVAEAPQAAPEGTTAEAVPAPQPAEPPAPSTMQTAAIPEGAASAGHETFNGTCAHCHGPDAIQSERRINLRLLHHRYGDQMHEVFWKTVHEGRPAKGMPSWKDIFSDEDFNNIYAYLKSVQSDQ